MGKAAKLKQERRKMRVCSETNQYMSNRDWLGLAKHFLKHGEQVLDDNMQPIEFESVKEYALYLESEFTKSAKAKKVRI